MDIIEFDRWKPSADDPRKLEYVGQRTAREVFEKLKHRLKSQGYLPDEYFLLDREWEDGREIPKGADIFCATDYGGSEGVYLDVYLKWYEDGKPITKSFITGKTLGENGNDLDRMFLISSAITKAFHGDHATHALTRRNWPGRKRCGINAGGHKDPSAPEHRPAERVGDGNAGVWLCSLGSGRGSISLKGPPLGGF